MLAIYIFRTEAAVFRSSLPSVLSGRGRGSSVSIATCYGPDGPGIESRLGETFRTRPDRPWGPHILLYNGQRVWFPVVEQPGRGANHLPPCNAEAKERLELYLHFPSGPSWLLVGRTLTSSRQKNHTYTENGDRSLLEDACTCIPNYTSSHSTALRAIVIVLLFLILFLITESYYRYDLFCVETFHISVRINYIGTRRPWFDSRQARNFSFPPPHSVSSPHSLVWDIPVIIS